MIAPFIPTHLHPCSFSLRPLPVCKPHEPCHGRCVATPPSTAYRFFYPTASPPRTSSSPSSSSSFPSPAGTLAGFRTKHIPSFNVPSQTSRPYFRCPISNLTREPETLQTNPPRPLTPIRLPCPAGKIRNISIEELHRSSQVQAKCWTQDSTELVVKVAPGRV
jgi:hypothetical protein